MPQPTINQNTGLDASVIKDLYERIRQLQEQINQLIEDLPSKA